MGTVDSASDRLACHVAASFLTIEPGWGSEPGNGWNWLEQIAQRVTRVTAVVTPYAAARLRDDARLPANVQLESPTTIPMVSSKLPVPSYYKGYASAHVALGSVLRELRADISHQVTLATPYWGTDLGEAPGLRVLGPVGVSRPAPLWAARHLGPADVGLEWARRALTRYPRPPVSADAAITAADHVLAVDASTARRAKALGRPVTMFMADGAHPARPDAVVGVQHRRHLVWVGRMMPRKGCELAVEAFARALPRLPSDERLILIGDGPERGNVERAVKRNGLEHRIEMTGAIPHDDVVGAIGHARALVFSSLRDAFGGVALEAAERATPTVWASHRGVDGLRTWLPHEAGWSRPVSSGRQFVEALADGMVAAATDPDPDWSSRSEAAYGFARDHSWSRRGDQMVDLYRRLLEERPSNHGSERP